MSDQAMYAALETVDTVPTTYAEQAWPTMTRMSEAKEKGVAVRRSNRRYLPAL